jgi:hypothetical protein
LGARARPLSATAQKKTAASKVREGAASKVREGAASKVREGAERELHKKKTGPSRVRFAEFVGAGPTITFQRGTADD